MASGTGEEGTQRWTLTAVGESRKDAATSSDSRDVEGKRPSAPVTGRSSLFIPR